MPTYLSIGIIAWNEEKAIVANLQSLFRQSLFREFASRNLKCEILCLPNGCTDNTAVVAERIFTEQSQQHSDRASFACRVCELQKRGKINAWNTFVHELSAKESRFLILMDADIILHEPDSLRNMVQTLEQNPGAKISIDRPLKDISLKPNKSLLDKLSLAATRLTQAGTAQLTGQLYCIRAETARKIYLPAELGGCDDGFIKHLVCTDFLTREVLPERIALAPEASHVFEAYTSARAILKNQKRQVMGQAVSHVLVDLHLKQWPISDRLNLAVLLRDREARDPLWLKRLVAAHLARVKFFWRLYPDQLTMRFKRLAKLRGAEKFRCLPTAIAGCFVTCIASFLAYRTLKSGCTDYWPHARLSNPPQLKLNPTPGATPAP